MNVQDLCKFAEIQRLSPSNDLKHLLCKIANWFNSLPKYLDEKILKEELLKAISNEDDIWDCSVHLEDNTATFGLYNSKTCDKRISLSEDEALMFRKVNNILPGSFVSISQHLDAGSPIQFLFYQKNEEEHQNFKRIASQFLSGIMIDYDFDFESIDEGDHTVEIMIPYGIIDDIPYED